MIKRYQLGLAIRAVIFFCLFFGLMYLLRWAGWVSFQLGNLVIWGIVVTVLYLWLRHRFTGSSGKSAE